MEPFHLVLLILLIGAYPFCRRWALKKQAEEREALMQAAERLKARKGYADISFRKEGVDFTFTEGSQKIPGFIQYRVVSRTKRSRAYTCVQFKLPGSASSKLGTSFQMVEEYKAGVSQMKVYRGATVAQAVTEQSSAEVIRDVPEGWQDLCQRFSGPGFKAVNIFWNPPHFEVYLPDWCFDPETLCDMIDVSRKVLRSYL